MMVMWSTYDGSDDAGGEGVVAYMQDEYVWKPKPEGGRERVRRVPPPEILRGDATLMRQAIRAVPFRCRYSSCVLSFAHDDIDVAAFNAGDPELRRRVAEVIQAFEESAYAGIPEEHRPPTFWTTHTHTGRLELNFCAPRAILAGDGRIRSINPHPPGRESTKLFDALRDTYNAKYGWSDPEDPARARMAKVPNWVQKLAAEAKRAGKQAKKHLAEQAAEWAEAALAAGQIQNRDHLIAQLRSAGINVTRIGADYITVSNDAGARIRLRGRIFSASFTSPEALRPRADALPRLDLAECEARLARHQARRAEFHRRRYGGPAWQTTEPVEAPGWEPPPAERRMRQQRSGCLTAPDIGGQVEEGATRRQRYQVRLWVILFGATLPEELLMALHWVNRDTRTVQLVDGATVTDHGDRITSSRSTQLAAALMVAEAKAKGWTSIAIAGSPAFQRLAIAAAVRAGLAVSNPELQDLVTMIKQENANEGAHPDGTRVVADGRPAADGGSGARAAADAADRRLGERSAALRDGVRGLATAARRGMTRIQADRTDELERFKLEIDLRAFATTLGFSEDPRASDRNHTVMRHSDGTKLIIGVAKGTAHWAFSSNTGEKGSVIDLLRWRDRLNLGQIRQRLRPWIGDVGQRPHVDPRVWQPQPKPQPTAGNAMRAVEEWESSNPTTRSVFLERSRGLDPETLASERFRDTFRVDERQNAVFPYRDGAGDIVGTERRNRPSSGSDRSFRVYTSGAAPGIWTSNRTPADTRLVVVESPIDAMSHYQLSSPEERAATRYAALRSGCSREDLQQIIAAMPAGAEIVAAADNDEQGARYNDLVRELTPAGRAFRIETPPGGPDWNDIVRARAKPTPARQRPAP